MPQHNKTIPEMQADIQQLQQAMQLPGIPPEEITIYQNTILRIQAEINARQAAPRPLANNPASEPIKHTAPPPAPPHTMPESQPPQSAQPSGKQSKTITITGDQPLILQSGQPISRIHLSPSGPSNFATSATPTAQASEPTLRVIHAGEQQPVSTDQTAHLAAPHDTDPYNPSITITWPDGYTITVTETEARGRFTTTLRDTTALRLVQQRRFSHMWRWSSPWRAVGYYRALITFHHGQPPTLRDLGIQRPNDITLTAFAHIVEKAMQKFI